MAQTIRIVLFIVLILGLGACAAPQPYSGGGYGYQSSAFPLPPEPPIPAGWANAYTPYMGMQGTRCYYHGFVQPTNEKCLNGTIQTPAPNQLTVTNRLSGAHAPAISGMSPETASKLLAALEQRDNPCTAKSRTWSTSMGAFIGAVAGAIISRGDERVAVVGALIGAAGGNSEVVMSCQAYTDTRLLLLAVLDQYGCSGQVRKTNGIVTDDEICNFRRSYAPNHQPPQIGDRTSQPTAAAARPRQAPTPGVVLGGPSEKPPK